MKYNYIQYGCGWDAADNWGNFDASPTLLFEKIPLLGSIYTPNKQHFPKNVIYGDIVKGLPINSGGCSGVYCSHILEHLSLEDFRLALRNTKKIIKAGGIFRLVVPDLEHLAKEYLSNTSDQAALEFMTETYLGHHKRNRGVKGFIRGFFGNSQHLWMWDYKALENELHQAGFSDIRRASFGDSEDTKFTEVENKDRWTNCLGVECKA